MLKKFVSAGEVLGTGSYGKCHVQTQYMHTIWRVHPPPTTGKNHVGSHKHTHCVSVAGLVWSKEYFRAHKLCLPFQLPWNITELVGAFSFEPNPGLGWKLIDCWPSPGSKANRRIFRCQRLFKRQLVWVCTRKELLLYKKQHFRSTAVYGRIQGPQTPRNWRKSSPAFAAILQAV